MMGPDEIRKDMVEMFATIQRDIDLRQHPEMEFGGDRPNWDCLNDEMKEMYRTAVRPFVAAMDLIGMLPLIHETETVDGGPEVRQRYATEWRPLK